VNNHTQERSEMLVKGLLATEMSGSLAGITASHGRGGQYFRARARPVNPSSSFQQTVRAIFGNLASAWVATLTGALRSAWDSYGDSVEVTDRMGESRKLTGLNWYIAMNTPRMQAGGARLDAAPIIYSMAACTPPTIVSATASTEVLSVGFTNTDQWCGEVGGKLLVYTAPPTSQSVTPSPKSWRYQGNVPGAVSPPTSPLPFTSQFPFGVGQRVWVATRAILADGRISPIFHVAALGT